MIDNRTAQLNLPLPDPSNSLNVDVIRIISALQAIDAAVSSKATPADISSAAALKVNTADIVDNLTSTASNTPLSAKQGNTLNGLIAALSSIVSGKVDSSLINAAGGVAGLTQSGMLLPSIIPSNSFQTPFNFDVAQGSGALQGSLNYNLPAGSYDGQLYFLEFLGLFVFKSTSTDPSEGETCIAPISGPGRWLLISPTWDFIYAWLSGTELAYFSDSIDALNASSNAHDASSNAHDASLNAINASLNAINLTAIHVSATLSFASIAANNYQVATVAVNNAAVGDRVSVSLPASFPVGLIPVAFVSAVNTVTIRLQNVTATAITPAASQTYIVTVLQGS